LLEYITLPDNLDREALVSQDSGTLVLGLGCSSPKLFFNGIDWTGASLHWIWQPETQSVCLNFLAQQGTSTSTSTSNTEESSLDHILVPCTIDSFQWTLEASCHSSSKTLTSTEATECRRVQLVEPIHTTTGINTAHRSLTMSAIQTFWKFGKLRILCVEMEHVALLGSFLSKAVQVPLEFNLEPDALFTCSKVALAAPGLPRTGLQRITLAKLVSMLTDWKTPNLQWKAPPVPQFESNAYHSLADVFRHVFNFLEDVETSTNKRGSQEQASATAKQQQQSSRGGLFGIRAMSQEDSSQEGATTTSYARRRLFGSTPMIEASSPATAATSTPSISTSIPSLTTTATTTATTTTIKQNIGDSLAVTAGCVATGASFVTPIGVAVSVAVMGVKDGLVATATKGKSTRDGEHYQLGDLTRGVLTSMQEKRTQRKQRQDAARTMDDAFDAYSFDDTTTSTNATTSTNDASNTTNSSNINRNRNNNHQFVQTNSG
jgi:hypothetical protein